MTMLKMHNFVSKKVFEKDFKRWEQHLKQFSFREIQSKDSECTNSSNRGRRDL